ncbi:HAD-IIIC family phosphatase [Amaricoccus solimangrovi]|uniref:HAD-IIIC family phosphatase n=1 Tax=Amaricoccus solimangrovi TaxID=2589815 RepID=A0A501WWJ4_9RHOB|nr:HAD-IIIC family phosphatase [Amaricoccus solimangrovi]TPE53092.1 HAD-IIIC family phosphatase [Amaricoccus solimangrovi]
MVAPRPALAALKETGNRFLAARRFDEAASVYEEAALLSEIPRGGLCVRLARAHLEAGRPEEAAAWLMPVVDTAPSFRTWASAARILDRCPPETWPRVRRRLRVALVGTWTTSAFGAMLRLAAARLGLALEIYEPDFGQYFNATLDPGSALHAWEPEAVVLAPDQRALGLKPFSDAPEADAEAAVARWSAVWQALRARSAPIIIQHGFATSGGDPLGHYAAGLAGARRTIVARVNRLLAERATTEDVGFLNVQALAGRLGAEAWFDDRGWYMAKMPYGPDALPLLARHTAAVLAARIGFSRRCLVLDLDNTLWGGVIGDDGVEGITLGGNAIGEAYADFQLALKELRGRGILLAACSKNDEAVARAAFREHPEMVLREEDFAAFVVNWQPKSDNLRSVAARLDLGLDSLAFFDDNPYERAEVRRALPEVDVPILPEDPTGYRRAIEQYPYFEPSAFTASDRARAEQYRARAEALTLRASAGSLADYQASLDMRASFGRVDPLNMSRVVQLINKTNQFNLTTRRRNAAELERLLGRPGAHGIWARLRDRFADHGLIAVAIGIERDDPAGRVLEIDTLLMSCRVLGRGVEDAVVGELARIALAAGCSRIEGVHVPTGRNGMVAELYARLGLAEIERAPDGTVRWAGPAEPLTRPEVPIEINWTEA